MKKSIRSTNAYMFLPPWYKMHSCCNAVQQAVLGVLMAPSFQAYCEIVSTQTPFNFEGTEVHQIIFNTCPISLFTAK